MAIVITIEDDNAIRRGICDALSFSGHQVVDFADGDQGYQAVTTRDFDLLLLDLVLPGKQGIEILAALRKVRPMCPVIILSAKGEEADRVRGLRAGADDYIVKPFGVDELLARIEAVLRRVPTRKKIATNILLHPYTIDLESCSILVDGQTVEQLTQREAELIGYLASQCNRPVPRDELLSIVWQIDPRNCQTRVVDVTISRLREKLSLCTEAIQTRHRQGYCLSSTVIVKPSGVESK